MTLFLCQKFVSPNHSKFAYDQFYWDSYFIMLGLIDMEKLFWQKLCSNLLICIRSMVVCLLVIDINFVATQPPFFSQMV